MASDATVTALDPRGNPIDDDRLQEVLDVRSHGAITHSLLRELQRRRAEDGAKLEAVRALCGSWLSGGGRGQLLAREVLALLDAPAQPTAAESKLAAIRRKAEAYRDVSENASTSCNAVGAEFLRVLDAPAPGEQPAASSCPVNGRRRRGSVADLYRRDSAEGAACSTCARHGNACVEGTRAPCWWDQHGFHCADYRKKEGDPRE